LKETQTVSFTVKGEIPHSSEWRRCKNTLETSGEDVKIHSKRVVKMSVVDSSVSEMYDDNGDLVSNADGPLLAENFATKQHTEKMNELVKKLVVSSSLVSSVVFKICSLLELRCRFKVLNTRLG
jgi:hypothetical protein